MSEELNQYAAEKVTPVLRKLLHAVFVETPEDPVDVRPTRDPLSPSPLPPSLLPCLQPRRRILATIERFFGCLSFFFSFFFSSFFLFFFLPPASSRTPQNLTSLTLALAPPPCSS